MAGFARDLLQSVRLLRRRPVASALIVTTFALGIGANTALFSVIKAVWIDAVPYPNFPELFDLLAALAAHAVIRRRREIGVRMAIGSTPSQVVALLVRQALAPAAVDPRDLPSFAGAAVIMLAAATLAAWLPARRAARIDPVIALRSE